MNSCWRRKYSLVTHGPAKTGSQSMADTGMCIQGGQTCWPQIRKEVSKIPKSHPTPACLWRQPINLFLALKLDVQTALVCADSFSVDMVRLFLFFPSLTVSSFACGNCQKQSRKKEQFLIKLHVSADLLVPRPNSTFKMFYLHYLPCLWAAAATADLLFVGGKAGMGTDGCALEIFKQFCVPISAGELLCLFNNKKNHQWPEFWWYQCLTSLRTRSWVDLPGKLQLPRKMSSHFWDVLDKGN